MASSSVPYNSGNVVVVTQVLPAGSSGEQQPLLDAGQRFKKGHPKALGTVQIMIGVITLLFGIAMLGYQPSLGTFSGIFVWGTALYIASGAVTVAAEKHLTHCLMTATLTLNIIAAIVAATGVILYSVDAVVWSYPYGYGRYFYPGYSLVTVVFQLLQLIVSITVAGFACSATCRCCREQQVLIRTVENPNFPQAPPQFQAASVAPAQPPAQMEPAYKYPAADFPSEPPAYQPSS